MISENVDNCDERMVACVVGGERSGLRIGLGNPGPYVFAFL